MPVTELYAFNLTCVILLMALYGVALNILVIIAKVNGTSVSSFKRFARSSRDV